MATGRHVAVLVNVLEPGTAGLKSGAEICQIFRLFASKGHNDNEKKIFVLNLDMERGHHIDMEPTGWLWWGREIPTSTRHPDGQIEAGADGCHIMLSGSASAHAPSWRESRVGAPRSQARKRRAVGHAGPGRCPRKSGCWDIRQWTSSRHRQGCEDVVASSRAQPNQSQVVIAHLVQLTWCNHGTSTNAPGTPRPRGVEVFPSVPQPPASH